MNVVERSTLGDLVARARLRANKPTSARETRPWVATEICPVHGVAVPLKADGSLGGYCHRCLGECAAALARWGYKWRLHGYVRPDGEDSVRDRAG